MTDVYVNNYYYGDSSPEVLASLQRIETKMADLQTALTDLQAAVAAVAERVAAGFGPLQDALAAAQQALTDFEAADVTEDAAFRASIDTLTASLNDALASASAAADTIETNVAALNEVAATPPA